MPITKITEIIEDIRLGKMVVMMDDEDRENEGDLIMAASKVTPWHINFMARYARGIICLPLSQRHCAQLNLPLMVPGAYSAFMANFTLSIEAATGVSTGVSAADRAHTILTAIHPEAKPEDIVKPGHIFPIMAQPGGVLSRQGHTEAGVDLSVLAGLAPAAVICEVLNEDGTMARRPQLEIFAKQHDLKLGTIQSLVQYRQALLAQKEEASCKLITTDMSVI
jgi:3,4-dihydroxy 2-butanone 4-phosphate synthase/GTP cyclohydrolase II